METSDLGGMEASGGETSGAETGAENTGAEGSSGGEAQSSGPEAGTLEHFKKWKSEQEGPGSGDKEKGDKEKDSKEKSGAEKTATKKRGDSDGGDDKGAGEEEDADIGGDKDDENSGDKRDTKKSNDDKEGDGEPRKTLKLKVNGEEIDYDISNTEKLSKDLQKGLASDKKFKEASDLARESTAKLEKQMNHIRDFVNDLKDDPLELLTDKNIGMKPSEVVSKVLRDPRYAEEIRPIVEAFIYQQMELDAMDPSYREQLIKSYMNEKDLSKYKRGESKAIENQKKAQQEREKQAQAELTQKYKSQFQAEIPEALKATGIPHTDWAEKATVSYMRAALAAGHKNVTAKSVMEYVKKDFDEIYEAKRKENLEKHKESQKQTKTQHVRQTPRKEPARRRYTSAQQMVDY